MQFINQIQRLTLYLFLFSINFEMLRPIAENENLSASKVFGLLYFVSLLPQYKSFVRIDVIKYYLLPIVTFFVLDTFMELSNINEFSSDYLNSSILLNIILFYVMINHERNDYLVLEKGMLCFAIGTIALTILFNFGIGVTYIAGRLSMFGDDQNYIGSRTSIGIIIIALVVAQNRLKLGWYRYLLLIPVPYMIKLLFETGSRLGFIAFALSIIAGTILYKTESVQRKLVILSLGVIFIFMSGMILIQSETMVERLKDTVETGNTAGRSEIWQSLIPIIKENPIFGVGHNGYVFHTTAIFGEEISPHNVILEVLCYTGIVGLILYFIFLFRIVMASFISYNRYYILLPLLLLIPVAGMILSIQILTKKIGWVIFAYIISSTAIKIKNSKAENESAINQLYQ